MKKFTYIIAGLSIMAHAAIAQPNISPAKAQSGIIAIVGGTIHIGNGKVIQNGTIVFDKGKIVAVSEGNIAPSDASIVKANGNCES